MKDSGVFFADKMASVANSSQNFWIFNDLNNWYMNWKLMAARNKWKDSLLFVWRKVEGMHAELLHMSVMAAWTECYEWTMTWVCMVADEGELTMWNLQDSEVLKKKITLFCVKSTSLSQSFWYYCGCGKWSIMLIGALKLVTIW